MNKLAILKRVKELYKKNGNIISYLRETDQSEQNQLEDIMISYDFQAGSYVQSYKNNPKIVESFVERLADYITKNCSGSMILEAGIGEATTLLALMKKVNIQFDCIYGFDISWSRIKVARELLAEQRLKNAQLFVGDLFCMPLKESSIDIVYTCHAIEPNGGKEKEILQELYRVTKRYLILLEPAYELAGEDARKRMLAHGYITNLYKTAIDLGYHVSEYSLYGVSHNPLNPTGFLVIEKCLKPDKIISNPLCCPLTKSDIERIDGVYYSKESLLAYPIVRGVPCLTTQHAIVATKLLDEKE